MLLRLYEPILWRSLNVANPLVRRNAATILVESFPLQDPDAPQRETDELLQKQFSTLEVHHFLLRFLCVVTPVRYFIGCA